MPLARALRAARPMALYRATTVALLALAAHCSPTAPVIPPLLNLDATPGTDVHSDHAITATDAMDATSTDADDASLDAADADGAMDARAPEAGTDATTCSDGGAACDGGCVDTQRDLLNCGACGNVCPSHANGTPTCSAGVCGFACADNFHDCNENLIDGCEADTRSDINHCGACAVACSGGSQGTPMCTAGLCSVVCHTGFADCNHDPGDGCEIDTSTSAMNCGACGTTCTTGSVEATPACVAGACSFACIGGYANCNHLAADGCEINLTLSVTNCGECGQVCPAEANSTPVCGGGVCLIQCTPGFTNCDGDTSNGCEHVGSGC